MRNADCNYRCKSVEPHGRLGKEIIRKIIIPISQSDSPESGTSPPGNIATNERAGATAVEYTPISPYFSSKRSNPFLY